MSNTRLFLTVPEAARLLRRTPSRLYQMIGAGQLPATEVGGRLMIPLAAWEQWLREKNERALAAVARKS